MTAAREIYEYIDSFAPFDSAMGFDNVGILVGDPEESSRLVLLALAVTSAEKITVSAFICPKAHARSTKKVRNFFILLWIWLVICL